MAFAIIGGRTRFWQWDVGQKLAVYDDTCGQVHFCNGTTERALVRTIYTLEDGTRVVDVPDLILQTAKPFTAYLYHIDGDSRETMRSYRFEVAARSKPADYGYVEPEGDVTAPGLTNEEKALILSLFEKAAYTEDASAVYNQLANLWNVENEGGGTDEPDIPDHTHSYTSSVTKAATCTTAGVRTYTCSCGHSYTETIAATGHTYVDGVCTVCGAADPDYEGDEPAIEGEQLGTFNDYVTGVHFYEGATTDGSSFVTDTTTNSLNHIVSNRSPETDAVVSVVFANNTGSDITFSAAIGCVEANTTGVLYGSKEHMRCAYAVKAADNVTLAAGESMVVSYTLRAYHHLTAYADKAGITITAFGTFDVREFASTIPLTASGSLVTVYSDNGATNLTSPGGATKYQTDVFEEDTTVRATFYSDTDANLHNFRNFICCYSSGNAGYYGVKMPDAKLRADVPWSIEYEVKAGHRLVTCIEPKYVYVEEV